MAMISSPSSGFASSDPRLAAIDASVRWPVIFAFLSAVHWLVTGTFLMVYAASLMHPGATFPLQGLLVELSRSCSFFTYGRVYPAATDALLYGWAGTVGLGLAIWVMARVSRVILRMEAFLFTALVFWNLGVAAGLIGIFKGEGTGVELLEFPFYASVILFLAYSLFAVWGVSTFLARERGNDHLSQAWLLTAFFALPWLLGAGAVLLTWTTLPGSGVMQGIFAAWYYHGILVLWIIPLALGVLYYLVTKISGFALRFGTYGPLAFWAWLVLAPWHAVHDLVGGPFPGWLVSGGLLMSGLAFLPFALIALSLVCTTLEASEKNHHSLVLPYLFLGSAAFAVAGFLELVLTVRSANELLRFTMFREAVFYLWVYGFFSFTAFGAIYYVVPRLFNFGWRSSLLIKAHFYASTYGTMLAVAFSVFGGFIQGITLESADPAVTISTLAGVSFSYYLAATLSLSLLSVGNGIFALHLGWFLLEWLRTRIRTNSTLAGFLYEPYQETPPLAAPLSAPPALEKVNTTLEALP